MIGFIGAGNMACAIASGMARAGFVPMEEIGLFDANRAQYARFAGAQTFPDAKSLVSACRVVFFSVKPQVLPAVLDELCAVDFTGKTVVSICAALPTQFIRNALPGVHVVRAMPNTPMLYGKGVCALSASEGVTEEEFSYIHALFSCLGTTVVLPEEQQNAIICVTGSSPAYFFEFVDAMAKAAQAQGFSYAEAVSWIADVMEGSAAMLRGSGMSPEELCRMVCSPGGTTLEAISVFREAKLADTVGEAMEACTRRAEELSRK